MQKEYRFFPYPYLEAHFRGSNPPQSFHAFTPGGMFFLNDGGEGFALMLDPFTLGIDPPRIREMARRKRDGFFALYDMQGLGFSVARNFDFKALEQSAEFSPQKAYAAIDWYDCSAQDIGRFWQTLESANPHFHGMLSHVLGHLHQAVVDACMAPVPYSVAPYTHYETQEQQATSCFQGNFFHFLKLFRQILIAGEKDSGFLGPMQQPGRYSGAPQMRVAQRRMDEFLQNPSMTHHSMIEAKLALALQGNERG